MANLATRTKTCPTWCTATHDTPGWHHSSDLIDTPRGAAWITDPGGEPRIFLDTNADHALSSMSLTETMELIASLGTLVSVALSQGIAATTTHTPAISAKLNA